jgi:hypothetical protein
LLIVLAGAAMLALRPWESDSVPLELPPAPRFEADVGDATPVAPGDGPALAEARVATPGYAVAMGDPVAVPARMSVPQLAVSPARPVAVSEPVAAPAPPPPPPAPPAAPAVPVAAPPQPAAASPTPEPVPVSTPVAPSRPPILSGDDGGVGGEDGEESPPVEVCEGEEYVIAISLDAETMEPVEVVVRRLDEGEVEDELRFDGDELEDALELAALLAAAEDCEWTGPDEPPTPEDPPAPEAAIDLAE